MAFVCDQFDTVLEICQLISGQKVCHYLGGDKGGGGSRQTVTNGDKGGGGVKNWDFYGDILFEWPQTKRTYIVNILSNQIFEVFDNFPASRHNTSLEGKR